MKLNTSNFKVFETFFVKPKGFVWKTRAELQCMQISKLLISYSGILFAKRFVIIDPNNFALS